MAYKAFASFIAGLVLAAQKQLDMASLVLHSFQGAGIFWYADGNSGDHPPPVPGAGKSATDRT